MSSEKYVKKLEAGEAFHMDQDVDTKVSFTRKHSRREKFLFAALVIFIAVAVVFIVLYVKQISTKNKVDAGGNATSSKPSSKSCLSLYCLLISSGKFIQLKSFAISLYISNTAQFHWGILEDTVLVNVNCCVGLKILSADSKS